MDQVEHLAEHVLQGKGVKLVLVAGEAHVLRTLRLVGLGVRVVPPERDVLKRDVGVLLCRIDRGLELSSEVERRSRLGSEMLQRE